MAWILKIKSVKSDHESKLKIWSETMKTRQRADHMKTIRVDHCKNDLRELMHAG